MPATADESSFNGEGVINDVESLRTGIIKTSRNEAQAPYTILLVGETGTGKSTFLEFIDNILNGNVFNHYKLDTLDRTNERGGSGSQSQTDSARIYELKSKNHISVRILDAPGLADTRGIQQDDLHKKSIATQIRNHIATVNAVLILVNGSVPRLSVSTHYALTTLSTLFPESLSNNIAFLFSNVATSFSLNFSADAIPDVLKHAPRFVIDNPIALHKNYLRQNDRRREREIKRAVERAEEDALETLVELFDWLDGVEPQPTTEIVMIAKKFEDIESKITDTLARMDQAAIKMVKFKNLLEDLKSKKADVDALSTFEKIVNSPVWMRESAPTFNYLCSKPNCYSTCRVDSGILTPLALLPFQPMGCPKCRHAHWSHVHSRAIWVEKQEPRVVVDYAMKAQWEAAMGENEKTSVLVAASERELRDLSTAIAGGMTELVQSVDEYAGLSLSGWFSGPLEAKIRHLQEHWESMDKRGVSPEELKRFLISVERMEGRLYDLKRTKENVVVTNAKEAMVSVQGWLKKR